MSVAVSEPHTSTNGIIRIPKRGRAKFQFGDDDASEPVIDVDVIEVYDAWSEIEWVLRDKEGVLPNDKINEHGQNRLNFVQAVVNDAYAKVASKPAVPTISRAEAEAFIVEVSRKAKELRDFFLLKKDDPSSAPASTAPETEIRFSQ